MATYYVVRVNRDNSDTHAAPTRAKAIEMSQADRGSLLEIFKVEATDAGAARLSMAAARFVGSQVAK